LIIGLENEGCVVRSGSWNRRASTTGNGMARKWKAQEDWVQAPTDQRIDEIFPEEERQPYNEHPAYHRRFDRSERVLGKIRGGLQSEEYLAAKAASAPWKPFLRQVPVGRDGMPENPSLRAAVIELAMEKYCASWGLKRVVTHLGNLMARKGRDKRLRKAFLLPYTAEEVLRSVVLSGRFKYDGQHFDFAPRKRRGTTEEDKLDNYEAIIRNVADRACETGGGKALAAYLFRTWRNLYSPLVVETALGRGMLVPRKNGIDPRIGAIVLEASVFIAEPSGVVCYFAPEGSLSTRWKGFDPVVDVDVSLLEAAPADNAQLANARLNPSCPTDGLMSRMNFDLKVAFFTSHTAKWRQAASEFVEEELPARKWRGFTMSLSKPRMLPQVLRKVLYSVLEPDVRKAASRDPFAPYELYNWFAAGGGDRRIRRIQASEAFPATTFLLREFEDTIDAGSPLVRAMMQRTGMSKSSIKALRGLHWQKIGAHNCKAVLSMAGVPKERVPASKDAWKSVTKIVAKDAGGIPWLDHLPTEMRGRFMKAASSDWEGYRKLINGGDFIHALADTAASIAPLVTGVIATRRAFDPKIFALLVGLVGGEAFGLKRLRIFAHDWHSGTARRTSIQRTILKKAFGERLSTWMPLTADLETEHGTMIWLVNEDDLAAEGQEMQHCVGSYVSRCVAGYSHIAAFHGRDGTRSTAEFELYKGRINPVQHRTHWNGDPTGDVVHVYNAFLKANAKKKFEVVGGTDGGEVAQGLVTEASEEVLESIRQTYADILPARCLSWSKEKWREEVARFATEGASPIVFEPIVFEHGDHRDGCDEYGHQAVEDEFEFVVPDFDAGERAAA
jgi:hypothetical protein